MSRMQDWLVTSLNESNVTASDAISSSQLSLVDRQRLKNWVGHFEMQLKTVLGRVFSSDDQAPEKML